MAVVSGQATPWEAAPPRRSASWGLSKAQFQGPRSLLCWLYFDRLARRWISFCPALTFTAFERRRSLALVSGARLHDLNTFARLRWAPSIPPSSREKAMLARCHLPNFRP